MKGRARMQRTAPVVTYSGHRNTVVLGLGFDVSSNGSILAAGNTFPNNAHDIAGEDRYVRLWSVNTGQSIPARISKEKFDTPVIGLQFSHLEDNGLWVAQKHLEYWSI